MDRRLSRSLTTSHGQHHHTQFSRRGSDVVSAGPCQKGFTMRNVYRVLAGLIAVEVMLQASFIVYGDAGMGKYIEDGGVIDKAGMEAAFDSGDAPFSEFIAFVLHGMNGMFVIPLLALLLLVSSFFAKVPGGVKWGAIVLGLVLVQVTLGLMGHSFPILGALHGINALLLFTSAVWTFWRSRRVAGTDRTSDVPRERVIA
jgi:heme A synthase